MVEGKVDAGINHHPISIMYVMSLFSLFLRTYDLMRPVRRLTLTTKSAITIILCVIMFI